VDTTNCYTLAIKGLIRLALTGDHFIERSVSPKVQIVRKTAQIVQKIRLEGLGQFYNMRRLF
jgi:hypothetical protein